MRRNSENATIFSPKDTLVHVSAEELPSGGVLIEVRDNGIGIPEARLAEMNFRLDNPPVIDVSVSRHMGLFAVARLADRHGVRVRLRAGSPRGLTALVGLPDSVIGREGGPADWAGGRLGRQAAASDRQMSGSHTFTPRPTTDYRPAGGRPDAAVKAQTATVTTPSFIPAHETATGARETEQAAAQATSSWFRSTTYPTSATADGPSSPRVAPWTDDARPFSTDGWTVGRHAAQIWKWKAG